MSSKSENAVLAKARAMYGRCLKDNDYRMLCDCRTVGELASYLKTRTFYGKTLKNLAEGEIHRGQLEAALRQELYNDINALGRYTSDRSVDFSAFITSKMEIEQIIRFLMLLNTGRPEEYAYSMPLSFDKFTGISLVKMAKARSFGELLEALQGTKYQAVIREFVPKEGERIQIARIEKALNVKNYASAIEAMSAKGGKADRKELSDVFNSMLDFENLARILRLKKYYGFSPKEIKAMLIPYGKLSSRSLDELCEAQTVEEVFQKAEDTYMGKTIRKLPYNDPRRITDALVNIYCKHHLRLSPNPTIVMISYVYLKEIELHNIVNIIEATRYGMPADEKIKLPVR